MRTRFAAALLAAVAAAGCAGGTPYPQGWQPQPGASPGTAWSTGSGAAAQTYAYAHEPFAGTLQDLGTREATAIPQRYAGATFDSSDTFPPCPGVGAIASFRYGADRVLVEGYAAQNGQAILVTYVRPINVAMGPEVASALEKALCVTRL